MPPPPRAARHRRLRHRATWDAALARLLAWLAGAAAAPPVPDPPYDPLDAWLGRALRGRFDAVAGEPVPEELLRMIGQEDRAAGAGSG